MEFEINSRKLGKKITFSIPGLSYVFVDLNGKPGTLGNQICTGGSLTGSTISFRSENFEKFQKLCKNWLRAYLKNQIDFA